MAVEDRSETLGQLTDTLASVSHIQEEDVERYHEAIDTMLNAFSEDDGYESGAHAVWALHRTAVWPPLCPGVILELALRESAAAPVT